MLGIYTHKQGTHMFFLNAHTLLISQSIHPMIYQIRMGAYLSCVTSPTGSPCGHTWPLLIVESFFKFRYFEVGEQLLSV